MTDQELQTIKWRLDRVEAEQAALRLEIRGLHDELEDHMREAAAMDAEEREWRRATTQDISAMRRSVNSINWKLIGFLATIATSAIAALLAHVLSSS